MHAANVIHGSAQIIGLFAIIAIAITALGTMLGLVKPADAVKYCGAIAGITVVMVLIVSVFVELWSNMSVWQKALVALIGFIGWRLRMGRPQPRKKKEDE